MKNVKNKGIYYTSIIVIIIVYLVIIILGNYFGMYKNDVDRHPVNNILATNEEDVLVFDYTYNKSKQNVIRLYNQFPISDEVGKKLSGEYKEHNFEINFNEKAVGVKYYITVEKLVNSDFDKNYIKIYLDNEGKIISDCYRDTGRIKTFNEYAKYENNDKERILYKGTVSQTDAERGIKRFTFKMWVSEDLKLFNENYYNQSFYARINVHATGNL